MRLDFLRPRRGRPDRRLLLAGLAAAALLLGASLLWRGGGAEPAAGTPDARQAAQAALQPPGEAERLLVETTLRQIDQAWQAQFAQLSRPYSPAAPLLLDGIPPEDCDRAPAGAGIFYCPADARLHVDLRRVARLRQQGGETGPLALGYLLAHGAGHHVQQLLGIAGLVRGLQAQAADPAASLALWHRLEYQAECFAGLALRGGAGAAALAAPGAAEAVLQQAGLDDARPAPPPPGATPPTDPAAQGEAGLRADWFRAGLQRGDFAACDSFAGLP
ncbi:neutral zinc metallopeptidase [Pseudoroseomonas cervicalis]|uniref:neutral zinc metallopeptidase n=1 Tax=Teichococcus cervicalis TaxID=204525 RepID=UPI0022F1D276|nr:neutral zinc metallopeptidase [Pseudoroseomonas cervicalis]WBV45412.1 neutral zinc metallopeptidase [Pseudoroseomonas cervicalis]